MRDHKGQRGAALILLIGITAALAILAASLVMLVVNQQGASAREAKGKTSMYYAEAALNSAVAGLKSNSSWLSPPTAGSAAVLAADMIANYNTIPDTPSAPRPTPTIAVYDNQPTVDRAITWDKGGGTTTPVETSFDGKVWVEASVTYRGRTSRLRQLVVAKTVPLAAAIAKAAVFCGANGAAGANDNITFSGSGDAYVASFATWPATNFNGVPYIGGAPFPSAIKCAGDITGVSATDLAYGSNVQSLGVQSNGTVKLPGLTKNGNPSPIDGAADLYSYIGVNDQLALVTEASECLDPDWQAKMAAANVDQRPTDQRPTDQRPAVPTSPAPTSFPNEAALRVTGTGNLYGTYDAGTNTFTANKDLYWRPANSTAPTTLTLGNAGTKYIFRSLEVRDWSTSRRSNLTLSGTMTAITATALRVGGALTISTTSSTNTFGSVYVVGAATIGGSSTNQFGPLWVDGGLTLSGTGAINPSLTTVSPLHVGGALDINSTASTNRFDSSYVVGAAAISGSSANAFGPLWVDGSLALNGTGATSATTLRVGANGLSINSTAGENSFGSTYVIGSFATTATSTSANAFGPLWVDGSVTLNGSGTTYSSALHVGSNGLSINSPTTTNTFDSAYVIGNLTTTSTSTSTNGFGPLWVDGAVTLSSKAATNATALHVGGAFTINSPVTDPVITDRFGCIYVVGNVNWGGGASVQTALSEGAVPGPMWIGGVFTRGGGPFNDVYGNTFVVFKVNFTPTVSATASTVLCPLLATTEMVTTSGNIDFGTMVPGGIENKPRPMTLFTVVDDIYFTQTVNWGSTGQFTGLMILLEQGIDISAGNATKPAVVGSVQSIGGDGGVKIGGNAQVAYCQDVINAVKGVIRTTITITEPVSGTWQELSPSEQ
jgi:hypothetical protein